MKSRVEETSRAEGEGFFLHVYVIGLKNLDNDSFL